MGLLKQLLSYSTSGSIYRRNLLTQTLSSAKLEILPLAFACSSNPMKKHSSSQSQLTSRFNDRHANHLSLGLGQTHLSGSLQKRSTKSRSRSRVTTRADHSNSYVFKCALSSHLSTCKKLTKTHARYFHSSCSKQRNDDISNTADNTANNDETVHSLIETWFYEVSPHGSLQIKLPFKTEIRSLPPQEYPDMNKVIIKLHFDTDKRSEIPDSHQLSEISDLYDLDVEFDHDKANMRISCDFTPGVELPIFCMLQVPLKCDLKINMSGDESISIHKMESDVISVETKKGDCYLNNIKCGSISAVSRAGSIKSKGTLLGNIHFHTGKSGAITTDKLQGTDIVCETEMGSVEVKSLYTENAIFRSDAGPVHLGYCHGQLYMQADKSVFKIDSLEGDLDIGLQSGTIEAHLSRHQKANIEVKTGDITLSFPEGVNTDLNLDCRAISVTKDVDIQFKETGQPHHKEGHIGEKGKAMVNARTLSGTVHLKLLDWIQTTKLSFQGKDEI